MHFRVSSPPYRWPCFYGMDTGDRSELLAADLSVGEIRDYVGVDSLAYLDARPPHGGHRRGRRRSAPPASRATTRSPSRRRSKLALEQAEKSCPSDARRRLPPASRARRDRCGAHLRRGRRRHRGRREAVELIKEHVRSTFRPEVVGDVGGFGGLLALAARPARARCWCRRPTVSARSR